MEVSWNLQKFPVLNCRSGNKALNFVRKFGEISESFLETVGVGNFLLFSRKFPRNCRSGYVLPLASSSHLKKHLTSFCAFLVPLCTANTITMVDVVQQYLGPTYLH